MNVIKNEIEAAIDKELQAATERFGLHHSNHEKMAVIVEEYEECAEAVEDMRQMLKKAWTHTMHNMSDDMMDDAYRCIYDAAVNVAVEACQVAAMAKKKVQPPSESDHGTAELNDHGEYTGHDPVRVFRCTNCNDDFVAGNRPHPFFCPKCGAEFTNVLKF